MKKFVVWLILFAVMLFGFGTAVNAAESAGANASVNVSTINIGDTVTVTISFKALGAYTLNVAYNGEFFEFDSSSGDEANGGSNPVAFSAMSQGGKNTITSATCTFKAKKAGQGSFTVSGTGLAYVDGEGNTTSYADFSGESAGTVTVKAPVVEPEPTPTIVPGGIILNESKKELGKNSSFQIEARITPENAENKAVTFTSNNPNVASVDETGKVTTKSVGGTAIITASTVNGIHAACEITVPKTAVTGLTLSTSTREIEQGSKYKLVANVLPKEADNKNVTWTSSDATIAKVDAAGVVTGLNPGTATITSKTADGNKIATCVVTIAEKTKTEENAEEPEEEVVIDETNANLESIAFFEIDVDLNFDKETLEYRVNLESFIEEVTVQAIPEMEDAAVQVEGEKNLKVGENEITITVTSIDAQTQKVYKIILNILEEQTEEVASTGLLSGIDDKKIVIIGATILAIRSTAEELDFYFEM